VTIIASELPGEGVDSTAPPETASASSAPSPQVAAVAPQAGTSAPQRPQYQSLRILRVVYLILGWIVLVGGTIGVIYLGAHQTYNGFEETTSLSEAGVVIGLVAVALYSLMLFAGASLITLFLRVEANSQETIELLRATRGNA
jgi:multisubunit Na+/H+ antiporter MnhG subunit